VSEVVGVCHLKAYVFDDDVMISGANLSTTYFTNRQDRYYLFKKAGGMAMFVRSLVKVPLPTFCSPYSCKCSAISGESLL
jgi:CDP-diacylglycerol--glycerol-3-phosphate 3-phosphatidyltransferase